MNVNLTIVLTAASFLLALFLVILSMVAIIHETRERGVFLIGLGIGMMLTAALWRHYR